MENIDTNTKKVLPEVTYEIKFFSEWHCGSGLSAGANTDALVIKDKDGLPFVPGKTIKGLFREAVEDLMDFNASALKNSKEAVNELLGVSGDREGQAVVGQAAVSFFADAELPEVVRNEILQKKLTRFLYNKVSSTRIGADGIAEDGSLRSMETTVPCTLEGKIYQVDETLIPLLRNAAAYIKRLGVNRNRGLGRCQITITSPER